MFYLYFLADSMDKIRSGNFSDVTVALGSNTTGDSKVQFYEMQTSLVPSCIEVIYIDKYTSGITGCMCIKYMVLKM